MNQKFSLPGMGPNLTDPLYGLFDIKRNFFYRVDYRQSMISDLYNIVKNLRTVMVVPLHQCVNWHRNLVDNSICINWGLDVFMSEQRLSSLSYNNLCLIENYTTIDSQTQTLINNLAFVTTMLDTLHKDIEYCWPTKVEIMFADDLWVKQAIEKEFLYFKNYKSIFETIMEEIKLCAQQLQIDQVDYCDQLTQQIKQITFNCDQTFFKKSELCHLI
jgi:hypothetical protein